MNQTENALPELGIRLQNLPMSLTFVRDLEEFEGPILSQYKGQHGYAYLEKWCAQYRGVTRTLVVRSQPEDIGYYLAGRVSLYNTLTIPNDDVGFIVDRSNAGATVVAYLVQVSTLPEKYLPESTAFHDKSLRPSCSRGCGV